VPEAPRGGHARHRPRARGSPSLECFGPRSAPSTRVERGVRKPSRAGRGSQVPGAATHRGDQRNRHRLMPASSGAKAPLACEDRRLVRVCPRVAKQVAEVGKRRRGPEKRDSRWQRGTWTGAWPAQHPQGCWAGEKASRTGVAVAKPREPGKSGAGRSRERRGARVLVRWKVSRIVSTARIVHASGLKMVSAAPPDAHPARAG